MTKLHAVLAAALVLTTSCTSHDQRLEGHWKSNKQLTVATIHFSKRVKPASQVVLRNLFGKLELTYDRRHFTAMLPPKTGEPAWTSRGRYRVVASDKTTVAIMEDNVLTGEPEITHVHFEGPNRFWFHMLGGDWREYFDRVGGPPQ